MLDIDVVEELIKKVGGKFKLTTLIQKRMVELHRPGGRPLVKMDSEEKASLQRTAIQEVLEDLIELAPREEVGYTLEEEKLLLEKEQAQEDRGEEETSGPASSSADEVYGSDIKKIKEQRIKELAQLLNPKK